MTQAFVRKIVSVRQPGSRSGPGGLGRSSDFAQPPLLLDQIRSIVPSSPA
jgi:hypothetical protein